MSRRYKLHCVNCDAVFSGGDEYYTWINCNGTEDLLCPDCFDEAVKQLTREEWAELLGSERCFAEYEGF